MDISATLSQFNTWKNKASSAGRQLPTADAQLRKAKRNEILISGQALIKQQQRLQQAQQDLQSKSQQLQQEWSTLQQSTRIDIELETGETHQLDLSHESLVQELWEQGSQCFSTSQLPPKETSTTAPDINLESIDISSMNINTSTSAKQLYNSEQLSAESDELLTHLT